MVQQFNWNCACPFQCIWWLGRKYDPRRLIGGPTLVVCLTDDKINWSRSFFPCMWMSTPLCRGPVWGNNSRCLAKSRADINCVYPICPIRLSICRLGVIAADVYLLALEPKCFFQSKINYIVSLDEPNLFTLLTLEAQLLSIRHNTPFGAFKVILLAATHCMSTMVPCMDCPFMCHTHVPWSVLQLFWFGRNDGICDGISQVLHIPFQHVLPHMCVEVLFQFCNAHQMPIFDVETCQGWAISNVQVNLPWLTRLGNDQKPDHFGTDHLEFPYRTCIGYWKVRFGGPQILHFLYKCWWLF